jgi:hypothetical protein
MRERIIPCDSTSANEVMLKAGLWFSLHRRPSRTSANEVRLKANGIKLSDRVGFEAAYDL